jgi:prepilin-type N-terminal cleavage/methylation domain-containing protein
MSADGRQYELCMTRSVQVNLRRAGHFDLDRIPTPPPAGFQHGGPAMHEKWRNFVYALKTAQASGALRPRTSWRHGFSLLEVVLVLAIIATLAAIATPRYAASLARYRADLAARRIVADLTLARSSAKAAGTSRTVEFCVSTNEYELSALPSLDGAAGNYEVRLSERPYEARLVSADFAGETEVKFSGWGIPQSGGAIVLSVGSEQRTVVVDAETGKATVQ